MILILSRAMAKAAARRWPDEALTRQEWLAELDFLAAHRGALSVLSYGVGLAFARPAQAPAIGLTWRTAGTALFLVAGPFALVVLCGMALVLLGRVAIVSPFLSSPAALWIYFAVCLAAGYLIGRWWGARSVLTGPPALALSLGLSVGVSFLLAQLEFEAYVLFRMPLRVALVWALALFPIVFLVARAAQRGWGGRAMLAAVLAWLVVLDIAVMVWFWPQTGYEPHTPQGYVFQTDHAPIWFLGALTNHSLGVLNRWEVAQIADDAPLMPHVLILLVVYAMSYAVTAVRTARA